MSIKVFILLKLIKIKNFVREILVNFILTSLKEYILDDISYLNIDTNTLYNRFIEKELLIKYNL